MSRIQSVGKNLKESAKLEKDISSMEHMADTEPLLLNRGDAHVTIVNNEMIRSSSKG